MTGIASPRPESELEKVQDRPVKGSEGVDYSRRSVTHEPASPDYEFIDHYQDEGQDVEAQHGLSTAEREPPRRTAAL